MNLMVNKLFKLEVSSSRERKYLPTEDIFLENIKLKRNFKILVAKLCSQFSSANS